MKLNEALKVLDYSYDFADTEYDCTFYANADYEKLCTKLIDVFRIDTNYVVCEFSKFIREYRDFVEEYIDDNALDKDFAEKLKQGLRNEEEWAYCELFDGGWIAGMLEEE